MRRLLFALVILAGCTKAGTGNESPPGETIPTPTSKDPGVSPVATTPPPAPAPKATTTVELTAVTLADDCGGTPPRIAPAAPSPKATTTKSERKSDDAEGFAKSKAKRRCEQTSMQLSITAGDASGITVKSVELFDDAGKSLGKLSASKPTRWSDASATYEAWDEKVAAGSTTSVSYVLEQPAWDQIGNRWNKTYTLKTVLSIGGVDQSAQKDVTLSAPTSLPPNVKT